ncbi:MAG TPA: hypothetical protein VIF62_34900 [Labilithrix sp.]
MVVYREIFEPAPPRLDTRNMTEADLAMLRTAIALLFHFARDEHDRVFTNLAGIVHCAEVCPSHAAACTGPHLDRWAAVTSAPSEMNAIDLAILLRHEAEHIRLLPNGSHEYLPHTCRDGACSDPWERFLDPIYRRDDEVRMILEAAVQRARRQQAFQAMQQYGQGFRGPPAY